ncbi:DUF4157 domain-containing protein [Streptomyces sp. SDr-06]|uniref:eCIS core domain-containing protein n=1 Tax=Streptomyces sp. SDr-06 TaxID=2267702 RepID=UPI000DEAC1A2|nr:DUF4157 domain-containing protein [Streptomyces sp. SDr-06]RCH68942.1 DUF4157 domain-containing protein [Streptomyces sp. SDr-06]
MHANEQTHLQDGGKPARTAAARPAPGRGIPASLRALQSGAGNAAVVQMLRQAGHPWAQEQHQHTAGCGHRRTEPPTQPAVQRSTVPDVLRTSGRPLDEATRTDMETRLGADFSDVRVHNDAAAKASATEVGARAYTSGNHIVIGQGGGDRHTLAHELTHVIQQRSGPVSGTDNGAGLKVSDPGDRHEREAEANATRVLRAPASGAAAARTTGPGKSEGPATDRPEIQRANDRSRNPHAGNGPKDKKDQPDWELTAHHIVPHTALKSALEKLDPTDRQDVLVEAIPDKISKDMLRGLGLSEEQCAKTNRVTLQKDLKDRTKTAEEIVPGTTYDEIRLAFFEWQGGNQFLGPNTSIRAEPSSDKDGIDVDGQYFLPQEAAQLKMEFSKVTRLGNELKAALRAGGASRELADVLKKLLALTRDVVPTTFDPAGWVELTDPQQITALAENKELGRSHLKEYSFFNFGATGIDACPMIQKRDDGHYYELQGADKDGSGWKPYKGDYATKIEPRLLQIKGNSTYVNMAKLRQAHQKLYEYCVEQKQQTSTFLPRTLCTKLRIA